MATRESYTRIFKDPEVRDEMLDLYRQGYSFSDIARRYDCDHTSVIHQCRLAGLVVGQEDKKRMFDLVKQGISAEDIGLELGVDSTVVDFYCIRYGIQGGRPFARPKLHLGPITPKAPRIPSVRATPIELPTFKIDDRGVEWRTDESGSWVCMGISASREQQNEKDKKKKALDLKRMEMLTY